MIRFKKIDESNFDAIVRMKRPDGEGFVASNAHSLAQAWLYREAGDVFPFAVYADDTPVGFMMLDTDDDGSLYLWRIMFPEEHCNKGYGTAAIELLCTLMKESGKYTELSLGVSPANVRARHVYEKLGFVATGEIEHGEETMVRNL